jgi:hypothetical protein
VLVKQGKSQLQNQENGYSKDSDGGKVAQRVYKESLAIPQTAPPE